MQSITAGSFLLTGVSGGIYPSDIQETRENSPFQGKKRIKSLCETQVFPNKFGNSFTLKEYRFKFLSWKCKKLGSLLKYLPKRGDS